MGCFESKNKKYKAKPLKITNFQFGQFNSRWKRLLQNTSILKSVAYQCNGVAQHPAFKAIEKDVERTFPNQEFFKNKNNLDNFKETLKCFSITFPKVGYTQGLNFLTGYLLINKNTKLETLNLLIKICTNPQLMYLGLYEDQFPLIEFYCQIFWNSLEKIDKQLFQCLSIIQIPDHMWIFQWYLTLFIYSFPIQYISFFFNFILQHKFFSMVKLSLAIVVCLKDDIINLQPKDQFSLLQYLSKLKSIDQCMKILNLQTLISNANSINDNIFRQSSIQIKNRQTINNFYVQYFCASQRQQKVLYNKFVNEVQQKKVELANSLHDQNLMQSYKRNRKQVQILDQILLESIKRAKNKKYRSNVVCMNEQVPKGGNEFRKWRSLALLVQDVKNEDETTISFVKKVMIPEEDEEWKMVRMQSKQERKSEMKR